MAKLPTREEMFEHADAELDRAYKALSAAADWLRSDWKPVGSSLTDVQARRRDRMFSQIEKAKAAINRARN
jgi:hypothetical protein